jgi:15-cis-phytoene synthase
MPTSSDLLAALRAADPDRYFCSLFAPARTRDALAALYLFNHELARARQVASSGPLALIRLHWWRETIEGAARRHPVAEAIAGLRDRGILTQDDLVALIDAREIEADEAIADIAAFTAYIRGTAGRLARLAGQILGEDCPALEGLGAAYGIAAILRANRTPLLPADATTPADVAALAQTWLTARAPRRLRAAALPAVLARRDLAHWQPGAPAGPRGLGDRLAVLAAALLP